MFIKPSFILTCLLASNIVVAFPGFVWSLHVVRYTDNLSETPQNVVSGGDLGPYTYGTYTTRFHNQADTTVEYDAYDLVRASSTALDV
jgi:hypothetical protein